MTVTIETLTHERIRELRHAADRASNFPLADTCTMALRGKLSALAEVVRVVNAAEAQP